MCTFVLPHDNVPRGTAVVHHAQCHICSIDTMADDSPIDGCLPISIHRTPSRLTRSPWPWILPHLSRTRTSHKCKCLRICFPPILPSLVPPITRNWPITIMMIGTSLTDHPHNCQFHDYHHEDVTPRYEFPIVIAIMLSYRILAMVIAYAPGRARCSCLCR